MRTYILSCRFTPLDRMRGRGRCHFAKFFESWLYRWMWLRREAALLWSFSAAAPPAGAPCRIRAALPHRLSRQEPTFNSCRACPTEQNSCLPCGALVLIHQAFATTLTGGRVFQLLLSISNIASAFHPSSTPSSTSTPTPTSTSTSAS